ncbi:hypothetical protein [Candidatus Methanodesulfokora washburnensis]|jgi:hypothetical protein|uniref:Uncharacterized protein n=1 Tax=Candidatus Methanodesulfokora washburnensis TaxID=2478471 RepID=A0A3R9RTC8_9CREN|nr:hypothetical protein [Candidatus Methanodesulfokores washburnensis]RSN78283.1 hypothetical protein D6D85_01350 [Candidatus Methanodesulfokores washburnensis]
MKELSFLSNVRGYISEILEEREKGTDPIKLIIQYDKIFSIIGISQRALLIKRASESVEKQMTKLRKTVTWNIDYWTIARAGKAMLFTKYSAELVRNIMGIYGVTGQNLIPYHNFTRIIYKRLVRTQLINWGKVLDECLNEFIFKNRITDEEMKDVLYAIAITTARVVYYLYHTISGDDEAKNLVVPKEEQKEEET